jgi:uncharacterized membrane protein YphA (DoxX/SURF4 family)
MNIVLWVGQAVLAALFVLSGLAKIVQPLDKLAKRYEWVEDFAGPVVRLIGVLEVLGAVGLVVPAATGVVPALTTVAATGLALMMLLAVVVHVRRKEGRGVVVAGVLLVLAALVAAARFGPWS